MKPGAHRCPQSWLPWSSFPALVFAYLNKSHHPRPPCHPGVSGVPAAYRWAKPVPRKLSRRDYLHGNSEITAAHTWSMHSLGADQACAGLSLVASSVTPTHCVL